MPARHKCCRPLLSNKTSRRRRASEGERSCTYRSMGHIDCLRNDEREREKQEQGGVGRDRPTEIRSMTNPNVRRWQLKAIGCAI